MATSPMGMFGLTPQQLGAPQTMQAQPMQAQPQQSIDPRMDPMQLHGLATPSAAPVAGNYGRMIDPRQMLQMHQGQGSSQGWGYGQNQGSYMRGQEMGGGGWGRQDGWGGGQGSVQGHGWGNNNPSYAPQISNPGPSSRSGSQQLGQSPMSEPSQMQGWGGGQSGRGHGRFAPYY